VKKLGGFFSPNFRPAIHLFSLAISCRCFRRARRFTPAKPLICSAELRSGALSLAFHRPNRATTLRLIRSRFAQRQLEMTHTILRLPAVKASTGLSRSTIYLRVSHGTFPRPVSLGGRAVGWREAEIQDWLQRRIEASRKAAA
jgi:prophage regulatory protein